MTTITGQGIDKVIDGSITTFADIKRFTSVERSLVNAESIVLAHGLGYAPLLVVAKLKCITAERGYAVGDIVMINTSAHSSSISDSFGLSILTDSTNIKIRTGTSFTTHPLLDATTGVGYNTAGANWKLIVEAI